ncbi:hypothetical protein, partial [Neisseria meningitidis]
MPSEAGFAPNTALMREIPIKGCKNAVRTETWFRRHFKRGLDSDFKCNTSVLVVGTDSRIKHLAFRSQVFFLVGGS